LLEIDPIIFNEIAEKSLCYFVPGVVPVAGVLTGIFDYTPLDIPR